MISIPVLVSALVNSMHKYTCMIVAGFLVGEESGSMGLSRKRLEFFFLSGLYWVKMYIVFT